MFDGARGWGSEGAAKGNNSRQSRKQSDGANERSPVQVGDGLSALFVRLSLSASDETKLKRFTQRRPRALNFIGELRRLQESKLGPFSRFLKPTICFNEHFFPSSAVDSGRVALQTCFFNLPFHTSDCSLSRGGGSCFLFTQHLIPNIFSLILPPIYLKTHKTRLFLTQPTGFIASEQASD